MKLADKAGVAHIDIDPSMSLPVKIVKGMCLYHRFNRIHPSIDTFFVVVLLWTQQIRPLLYWLCVFVLCFLFFPGTVWKISPWRWSLLPNKRLYILTGLVTLDVEIHDYVSMMQTVVDSLVQSHQLASSQADYVMQALVLRHSHLDGKAKFNRSKSYGNLRGLESMSR